MPDPHVFISQNTEIKEIGLGTGASSGGAWHDGRRDDWNDLGALAGESAHLKSVRAHPAHANATTPSKTWYIEGDLQ